MLIKISSNLKKQEIWANGTELASIMGKDMINGKRVISYPDEKKQFCYSFNNPVLLTDNYRISKLNPTLRDTLFSLYSSMPRTVYYDNTSVTWDNSYINVWGPSIDTVLFAKSIKNILKNKNLKKAIEIGCGSGFLSKFVLEKSSSIKSMIINDINPYAVKCAMDNIKDNRALFYSGDGLIKLKSQKYDLIICNPPYVPRKKSIDDNPYEGIGLLNHLVHNGYEYLNPGGILITNISSLCWKEIFKQKSIMQMKILDKLEVPLKVNNILNNRKWLNFLLKNSLKKNYHDGYEYWQTINIIEFTKLLSNH